MCFSDDMLPPPSPTPRIPTPPTTPTEHKSPYSLAHTMPTTPQRMIGLQQRTFQTGSPQMGGLYPSLPTTPPEHKSTPTAPLLPRRSVYDTLLRRTTRNRKPPTYYGDYAFTVQPPGRKFSYCGGCVPEGWEKCPFCHNFMVGDRRPCDDPKAGSMSVVSLMEVPRALEDKMNVKREKTKQVLRRYI